MNDYKKIKPVNKKSKNVIVRRDIPPLIIESIQLNAEQPINNVEPKILNDLVEISYQNPIESHVDIFIESQTGSNSESQDLFTMEANDQIIIENYIGETFSDISINGLLLNSATSSNMYRFYIIRDFVKSAREYLKCFHKKDKLNLDGDT